MKARIPEQQNQPRQATTSTTPARQAGTDEKSVFTDHRPAAAAQRRLTETMANSPSVRQLQRLAEMMGNSPRVCQQKALADIINNGPCRAAQRQDAGQRPNSTDPPVITAKISGPASPNNATIQMTALYHGGGRAFIESAIAEPHSAKESAGELGSRGMYYWKDDENAALVSAAIYNPLQDWAVMKIDLNPEVAKAHRATTTSLVFPKDSVAPYSLINGAKTTIYGLHYRFIQNHLETRLGDAPPDASIEGDLPAEYQGMTGRELLDGFDIVVSPTKAEAYSHQDLRQVRANDAGLQNAIYGEGQGGETNTFTKTWDGKIADQTQQNTIEQMGLGKRHQVPEVLLGMNGKKNTVVNQY